MKKANEKKQSNKVQSNGNCDINMVSGNIMRTSFVDQSKHKLQIDIARSETSLYVSTMAMEKARIEQNKASTCLALSIQALTEFDRYIVSLANEKMIMEKMQIIDIALTAIGITMNETELRNKAITSLNLSTPLTATPNKATKRLTINNENVIQSENGRLINQVLINECILQFKCSFAQLPVDRQLQFNESTRNRYSSLIGYFKQLQCKGEGKKGYFAEIIRQNRLNDLVTPITATTGDIIVAPDKTTRSRFNDALTLFNS